MQAVNHKGHNKPCSFLNMFTGINAIFRTFIRVCLLQSRPQDLPASSILLTLSLVIYTAVNVLLALYKITVIKALQASMLESLLVSAITFIILMLCRHGERWLQTLTALAGTGCIMSLLALPIFYGSTHTSADAFLRVVIFLLYLGLLLWNVTVMAHILRHALDTTFAFGVIFALTYIFITSMLIDLVIPELAAI